MRRTGVVLCRRVGGEKENSVLTQFKNRKLYKKTFKKSVCLSVVCVCPSPRASYTPPPLSSRLSIFVVFGWLWGDRELLGLWPAGLLLLGLRPVGLLLLPLGLWLGCCRRRLGLSRRRLLFGFVVQPGQQFALPDRLQVQVAVVILTAHTHR